MSVHPIFLTAFGKKALICFTASIASFASFLADAPVPEQYKSLFDLGLAGVVILGMATAIIFLAKSYRTLEKETREMTISHANAIKDITNAHTKEALEREDRLLKAIENLKKP